MSDTNQEVEVQAPAIFDGPSSPQIDQLAKALSAAQADMQVASMDKRNPYFNSRYSSLGAIIAASAPAMGKNGLSVLPITTWAGDKLKMRTILLHASGQWIDCGTLEGVVSVPPPKPGKQPMSLLQAGGSVFTYLRRYSRQAVCQVYGDEDTDGNGHPDDSERSQGHPEPDNGHSREEYIAPEQTQVPERFWKETDKPNDKTRMWILNKLKAAPGQPNWTALACWLRESKVITDAQTPSEWPLDMLPSTRTAFESVMEGIEKQKASQ